MVLPSLLVFKMALVSTSGVPANISLYFCNGSVDIAEPVSSSIFRVCRLIFGVTQMTSPTVTWLTFTSSDTTKLSSSLSSPISKECRLGLSSLLCQVVF